MVKANNDPRFGDTRAMLSLNLLKMLLLLLKQVLMLKKSTFGSSAYKEGKSQRY